MTFQSRWNSANKDFRLLCALLLSVPLLFASACGGGSSNAGGGTPPSNNPVPTVTSLSPASLTAGATAQTLTITGTGFLSASTVTFNGASHAATYLSASQLTISLTTADLASAGSYPVVVTNPAPGGGASAPASFIVTTTNPIPTISLLAPTSLAAGATAQTLTITGTGFLSASTVTFNGVSHAATYLSASQLTISLTTADLATAGSYPVVVTNPAPGGGSSAAVNFTVTATSTITGVSVVCSPTSIQTNQTSTCTPTVTGTGSFSNSVSWAVSPTSMGTVSSSGVFTPSGAGTATITATSTQDSTKSGSASVAVTAVGTLSISISGLPSGVTANVVVTGLGGFTSSISSDQTIQNLVLGTYTITANAVDGSNSKYYAGQPTQTVTLVDATPASIAVAYTISVLHTTKTLDDIGNQTLVVSPDSSTLTISIMSSAAASLEPGDILAVGITPATPTGLLKRIVSVDSTGNQIILTVSPASLADAFENADINFNQSLSPQNLTSAKGLIRGASINTIHLANANGSLPTLDTPCPSDSLDIEFDKSVILTNPNNPNETIEVSGDVQVCPELQFSYGVFPPSVSGSLVVGQQSHLGLTGTYSQTFGGKLPVPGAQLDYIFEVLIGPVPVVFHATAQIYLGAEGELTGSFTTGATEKAVGTLGMTWSLSNGLQVTKDLQATAVIDPIQLQATATSKVYAELDVNLGVYDIVIPNFSVSPYLKWSADVSQNPWWVLNGGITAGVGLDIDFPLVGSKTIASGDIDLADITIANAGGPFAKSQPRITSIAPAAINASPVTQTLTLAGTGFQNGLTLSLCRGGICTSPSVLNSGTVSVTFGAKLYPADNKWSVQVINPDQGTSNIFPFSVSPALSDPTITGITPAPLFASTTKQQIGIQGTLFQQGLGVELCRQGFCGAPLFDPDATVSSDQSVMVNTVLDSSGSWTVQVLNPDGGKSANFSFVVEPAFSATISPSYGMPNQTQFTDHANYCKPYRDFSIRTIHCGIRWNLLRHLR
jgi:hypothetical protein